MDHKLIMMEGLPGTGKTTLASWLHNYLNHHGFKTTLLLEGHAMIPCDYYETAVMTLPEYDLFSSCYANYSGFIEKNMVFTEHYACIRFERCPASLFPILQKWDMGDELNRTFTYQDYAKVTLERLELWKSRLIHLDSIVIIDGGFLQNPINQLYCRNATPSYIRQFIHQIFHIISPFNPLCIYLQRETSNEAFAFAKRMKGDAWAALINRLARETTCEDIFEQRFQMELSLLDSIEHIQCQIYGYDWASTKYYILQCLFPKKE